jgi:hypothetical protein
MTTQKQKKAAKKNIKKAQKKWQSMTHRQRAIAQPEGRKRAKPGSKGEGKFYRITVRDKNQFSSFRTDDVGEKGGIERVAGHRKSGSWDTQAWLISKSMAKKVGDTLESKNEDVKKVLDQLGSKPKHVKGDIFEAKPRPNIPEEDKPTKAQRKAREENIKKAQKARRKE